MGQSPSSGRGDVFAAKRRSDNEEDAGSGCGCLFPPRFLRRGGKGGPLSEEGWSTEPPSPPSADGIDVADVVVAEASAGRRETDPAGDLVLTDVEDEDEAEEAEAGGESALAAPSAPPPPPPDGLLSVLVAVDCGLVRVPGGDGGDFGGGARNRKKKKRRGGKGRARYTVEGGLALRRVCVVDGRGSVLLDATVRAPPPPAGVGAAAAGGYPPPGYYSRLAGHLSSLLPRINRSGDDLDAGLPAEEVRSAAAALIRGRVVVGHSVGCDLAALGLADHPPERVRDTAAYPPFAFGGGRSRGLRSLVRERLRRDIQATGEFHTCQEDAVAALDLYKSVWADWETRLSSEWKPRASANIPTGARTVASKAGSASTIPNRKRKKKKKKKRGGNPDAAPGPAAKPPLAPPKHGEGDNVAAAPPPRPERRRWRQWLPRALLFPVLVPARAAHDLTRLAGAAAVSLLRRARFRLGAPPVPAPFSRGRRVLDSRRHRRRRRLFRSLDALLLAAHGLSEALRDGAAAPRLLADCVGAAAGSGPTTVAAAADDDDHSGGWDPHSDRARAANGAIAAALIGAGLLLSRSREAGHARTSFAVLAQYHLIAFAIARGAGVPPAPRRPPPSPGGGGGDGGDGGWGWIVATLDDGGWVEGAMEGEWVGGAMAGAEEVGALLAGTFGSSLAAYHLLFSCWFALRCVVPVRR